jgi:site-specific DNA-methyltransferase (adenine-specific)
MNKLNLQGLPDVLSFLSNISSDEIFTSPKLARSLLDQLPPEIWKDSKITFLDPCVKSGVFLREIASRLVEGLEEQISDRQERINHVLTKQVFGMAITQLTGQIARRSIYGSKTSNGKYSFCSDFPSESGNIWYENTTHVWKIGQCKICGARRSEYPDDENQETYAYGFIHNFEPEEIFSMKFDVIIGNPPYSLDTGGSGRQAKPIYQHFIRQAMRLNPRYLSMIVPSKWFGGGMGLDDFRKEMLADKRIRRIVDFLDANEVFPDEDIPGGVCYFLWDRDNPGSCEITNVHKGIRQTSVRELNEFPTFVRQSSSVPILRKCLDSKKESLSKIVSSTRPFGLSTKERPSKKGEITLIHTGGQGLIQESKITTGDEFINKWKVLVSKTSHDHGGNPDKDGARRVLSRVEVIGPKVVCTESYIVIGPFKTKREADNCAIYLRTKFVRHLISLLSFSQDITRERFNYVPMEDFSKPTDDANLYKKYDLTDEEVTYIESSIKAMG